MRVMDSRGQQVMNETKTLLVQPRSQEGWQTSFELPDKATATRWHVRCELSCADQVIDHIEHEINILDETKPDHRDFMRVEQGNFYVGDRKWYPVGVNYWPRYVAGMEHADFWAGWLQRSYYDPGLVELDLDRLQALGINMVSIQSSEPEHYRNLLDFIERCGQHHIYVNLFCGLASPLDFHQQVLRDFISVSRLDSNPTVLAYDTIWEPGNYVFRDDWRDRWDGDWNRWLLEQYGSVANAEQDWEFPCPRDADGTPTSPPTKYFREDGPWRVLMAAYRRFMDDLMSRKWNQAQRRCLRSTRII